MMEPGSLDSKQRLQALRSTAFVLAMGGVLFLSAGTAALDRPATAYEGFGAVTRGARDCPGAYATYRVTSLADSGPGTFRDAASRGCRYVVFDVGGTITLRKTLTIRHSYITVDGASAPAPGITLEAPFIRTAIEARRSVGPAHDIIIHHVRVKGAGGNAETKDIWELDGSAAPVYNVILDHITAIAASDGIFDIYGNVRDVTISNNLYMETIGAQHLSKAAPAKRQRISIHRNVFARNNERQIRLRYDNDVVDIVNNVVYGWGWFEGGAAGLHLPSDPGYSPKINVENNVYHYVPGLRGRPDDALKYDATTFPGSIYFSGNRFPPGESDERSTSSRIPIPAQAEVTKHPASSLGDTVVPCVGTVYPTPQEQALLNEVSLAIGGTGGRCQSGGSGEFIDPKRRDPGLVHVPDGEAAILVGVRVGPGGPLPGAIARA